MKIEAISNLIPFFASKFPRFHFKRLQIKMEIGKRYNFQYYIKDNTLDQHLNVYPKLIKISCSYDDLEINELDLIL